jgi:transposase
MDIRELKALELAARTKITFVNGYWIVPSQSRPSSCYRVRTDPPWCECDDFQLRQQPCKHVRAAQLVCERDGGGPAPPIDTGAVPHRPTYRQNWPAYNVAQAVEKRRVRLLLREFCLGLPDRPRPPRRPGPKPHRVRDMAFAMVYKVYCGLSTRRFSTDLTEAHQGGFLSRPIPGAKVAAFFEDDYFTPILKGLIGYSAGALRGVETEFSIDSTGFASSRHETWYDKKYGVPRRQCAWVKAHIASGRTTHVVTAVRILDKDAADSPQFVPLVRATRRRFQIGEVSADKAYASVENFEEVAACGGQAFIAFKSNATGGASGLFEKAYHYFQYHRQKYLEHYHKRSNIESTISAVKRKFGDFVLSKTDAAMVNEVLCKLLCQNLTCLVQEQEALGPCRASGMGARAARCPMTSPRSRTSPLEHGATHSSIAQRIRPSHGECVAKPSQPPATNPGRCNAFAFAKQE